MRILIAEDDTLSRIILKTALESLGHECLVAVDGLDAWERWQADPTDVIISDWLMPGLDGIHLCQRVRASSAATYTYFILLSTLVDRNHYLEGMQAGADDYLTKPLNLDELRVRLLSGSRVTDLHKRLEAQNRELARLNEKLREEGRRDALTQVGNRLRLSEDLLALEQREDQAVQICSVALCDIDRFKKYNDHYGHMAGDQALREVACQLSAELQAPHSVYRFGGEEFLLTYPSVPFTQALDLTNQLRVRVEDLRIPHEYNPPNAVVTISAGVVQLSPKGPYSFDAAIRQADAALYRAKEAGRNRVMLG